MTDLVRNQEDRFSYDEAHVHVYRLVEEGSEQTSYNLPNLMAVSVYFKEKFIKTKNKS